MGETSSTMGAFGPGFDFFEGLTKGAAASAKSVPNMSAWMAPTLDIEELEKRINELKTVQFWLEQNVKAMGVTVQALEVQKMTLATLKGMNVQMADLTKALKMKSSLDINSGLGSKEKTESASMVDPLQMWTQLTHQFQSIATDALKNVAKNSPPFGGASKPQQPKSTGANTSDGKRSDKK